MKKYLIAVLAVCVLLAAALPTAAQASFGTHLGLQEDADGLKISASALAAVPGLSQGGSLDTVMIICAAIGGVCILIPLIFGRKKKKKETEEEAEEAEEEKEKEVAYDADSDDW